jgi:glycyl-tRNA synthetase beta chain
MPDLLIELFSEEIPARMQTRAADDLKKRVTDGLVEAGLTYGGAMGLSTPRRLTLAVEGMLAETPTLREERKGPKVGAPDKAVDGFARGAGVARDQLEERETPKGLFHFATIEKAGQPAAEIVAEVVEKVIRNFPWPKSMRWGAGSLRWVRPLQSILCILSDETGATVVPLDIDGLVAGDSTEGHRFMSPGRFSVVSFEDYEAKLKRAHVVLSAQERADHIWADASNLAFAAGLELVEDKGLLAEVAGLVEWPVVLMGRIGADYLGLPPEVLQTSMREHQKFFSLRDKSGAITGFITVANRETADSGATILAGNEKVLSARLADARFFWDNDLKVAQDDMSIWTRALENVTFHNKLGSQGDRIRRITALSRELAGVTGADADQAATAAGLAKADLSSQMVYEFPELQGLMGCYYIKASGLDAAVAAVAQEHYSPLGPSDDVPTAPLSVTVALADKIDTLTGFWAIDEKPTGSKDPFALRRAALGVIRLIVTNELRLPLDQHLDSQLLRHKIHLNGDASEGDLAALGDLLNEIADHGVFGAAFKVVWEKLHKDDAPKEGLLHSIGNLVPDMSGDLLSFIHDRLKVYLRDEGIRHDIIDACIAMDGNDDLNLLVKRARALASALDTEDGANLVQGFKRANNILTQAEEKDGVEYSYGADVKYAETDSEKALFGALDLHEPRIQAALKAEDFTTAVTEMAALRPAIDAFFEDVKVNADSEVLRRNRLNLLSQIRKTCGQVADLTRIEG